MKEAQVTPSDTGAQKPDRREFLYTVGMAGGLIAGYGGFALMAGRYLYPARPTVKGWLFVAAIKDIKSGDSLVYRTPSGAPVAIARRGHTGGTDDFVALSNTCPHLGCQVRWEPHHGRFFCPCHNGIFDPSGKAISGPPAEAGQSLIRYPLKIESGLLYVEVPLDPIARSTCPGHDRCLAARPPERVV